MSNTIRFLESMGNDPALGRLSIGGYAAIVASLDVEPAQRDALLQRDCAALNGLLGGRNRMICAVYAPEDEPLKQDEEHEGDQDEHENESDKLPSVN